ncbi:MAG: hypothetical protein ACE366_13295 [Bradymonadia bacterium]
MKHPGRSAPLIHRWPSLLGVLALTAAFMGCQDDQARPEDNSGGPQFRRPDMSPEQMGPEDAGMFDAGGTGEMADAELADAWPDAANFEQVPFAVETRVGERRTPAGLENRVTCQVLDQQGAPITGHETLVEVHPDNGFEVTEDGLVGEIARDYRLVCTAPALGLRDPTPADWTVTSAAPAVAVAEISDDDINAGDEVEITCRVFDDYGNEIDADDLMGDPLIGIDPPPAGLEGRPNDRFRITSAGVFDVTCVSPGAESAPGVALQVRPGLPARLSVAAFPERPVYQVGNVVELTTIVTDRFDNPLIGVPIVHDAEPQLPDFGFGRYQAAREGRYILSATVEGETQGGVELTAEEEILVDLGGPGIICDRPAPGEVLYRPENGQLVVQGRVADVAAIDSVTVDGEPVPLSAEGQWSIARPVRWGLNVHEVVAVDENGNENSQLCAYFASDDFLSEQSPLADALVLRLGQGAIDDGAPDNPISSISDVLRRILNSQGLIDTVNQAALAQNPIVRNECRTRVLGVCLFRFGVDYEGLGIGGPNTLRLTLVDGGLQVEATVINLEVRARLRGTLGNRARIIARRITIGLTFDIGRRFDGNPTVSLRSLDRVDVGDLDADFSGFITGFILELAFEAFEGLIRRTVVDALEGFLTDNIDAALEGLLNGLDIGDLAQGFDVPSLTGGAPVRLTIAPQFSAIDFTPARALFGIQTRVQGPNRQAGRNPGVPLPPGSFQPQLPGDRTVGASVAVALLNQILHKLWRAGYFDAEAGGLVEGVAADLPDGAEVFFDLPAPPAVIGSDGQSTLTVFLGPANAGVIYPGIFAEPFPLSVAAEVQVNVRLVGEKDIVFDGVRVVQLHLGLGGASVQQRSREILEQTLTRIIQNVIDRALNDGLPTLPLPEFEIPQSLGQFGLPAGRALGLRNARLSGTEAHWILDGNFQE